MRHYSKIINSTKKQFIDIDDLGDNSAFKSIGGGVHAIALSRLLVSFGEMTDEQMKIYGNPEKDEFYAGVWAGDNISIAGDYDLRNPKEKTSEIPYRRTRSLYDLTKENEYSNVTLDIIRWLARDEEVVILLIENARDSSTLHKKLLELAASGEYEFLQRRITAS